MELKEAVVVVTGAGAGIGRAMVHEFMREGASVAAIDVDGEAAAAALDAGSGRGESSLAVTGDVAKPADVATIAETVFARFGHVDILCNNAGVFDGFSNVEETDDALWEKVMGVNVRGPFLMSRAFIPAMLRAGHGAIVNTASISAFVAGGGGTAYTTSKHAVVGLTRQLAFDYGGRGIRVNAICPGATHTSMTAHYHTPAGRDEAVDNMIAATPAGRWAQPSEIAKLAVFLASDAASFIHGAAYVIDGGATLA